MIITKRVLLGMLIGAVIGFLATRSIRSIEAPALMFMTGVYAAVGGLLALGFSAVKRWRKSRISN